MRDKTASFREVLTESQGEQPMAGRWRSLRWGIWSGVLALLLIISGQAIGQTSVDLDNPDTKDTADTTVQETEARPPPFYAPTADLFQARSTALILALSRRLDNFFVDPNVEETVNRTRLRLRLGVQYAEGGKLFFLQSVRLNLDLPETRQRLGLFFDRDRDEENDQTSSSLFGDDRDIKFNIRSGIRYSILRGPGHHLQFQLGSRLLPRVEPFVELNGGLAIPLGKWLMQPNEILFWRDGTGFGETSRLDFDYPLSTNSLLRFRTEGTFSESSAGYEYLQAITYSHQLSPHRGYQIALQANAQTRPDNDVTAYSVSYTWRQLIYQDWLFIEVIPRVDFPEDQDYGPSPAISLILEGNSGYRTSP